MSFDPKTAAPTDVAKAVADSAPSKAGIEELAAKVADHLGKSMGEQFQEYARQLVENAQKAVEGKPEEASKPDAANNYQAKTAAEWLEAIAPREPTTGAGQDISATKAMCNAMAYTLLNRNNPAAGIEKAMKDKALGRHEAFVAKAMGVDDFSAGGALLQTEMASEVVGELLSETALFNDSAIMRVPVNGQMEFNYEVSGPTLRHVAENGAAYASESSFNQVTLRPEAVPIIVPVSKKMLRSVAFASQAVEQSMRRKFADRVDEKLIRGDGTLNTQRGLRYLCDSSNVLTVNATVSVANVEEDLIKMQRTLQTDDVPWSPATARYAFSPRTWQYLFSARGSDVHIFRAELLAGRLLGVPVAGQSGRGISNIPEDLAVTGTSESEVYLYETSGLRLGIGSELQMMTSDTAAYNDSSGTVQAAMSRNQTVFALHAEIGMVEVYRGLGICVLSDVDWGA